MELHRTMTNLERQKMTASGFEGSASGSCVQMRQRLSVLPGKRARHDRYLKVFVGFRLVFEGFEIEEAEGVSTASAPRRTMKISPRLKTPRTRQLSECRS